MKLKFKQQQYQDDAVGAIVNCFKGQEKGSRKDLIARYKRTIDKGTLLEKTEEVEVISFGNHPITLTESERRENIRNVQRINDINYTTDNNKKAYVLEETLVEIDIRDFREDYNYLLSRHNDKKKTKKKHWYNR